MFFSIVSSQGFGFFLVFPWWVGCLIISLKCDISRERSFRNALPLPPLSRDFGGKPLYGMKRVKLNPGIISKHRL